MRRVANRLLLKPGMKDEYKRRHDNIWPEMLAVMKEAGVRNYTIWHQGGELFGYYEVNDYERCIGILSASDVARRWRESMADVVVWEKSPRAGLTTEMELVFSFATEAAAQ